MLIQCKNCHVSFDLSFENCIVCGTKASPSEDEFREDAIAQSKSMLIDGFSKSQIQKRLALNPKPGSIEDSIQIAHWQETAITKRSGWATVFLGLGHCLLAFFGASMVLMFFLWSIAGPLGLAGILFVLFGSIVGLLVVGLYLGFGIAIVSVGLTRVIKRSYG